jgi:hypothetical protein
MEIGKAYFGTNVVFGLGNPPPLDPDAQAFITATGITGTDATAINTLVVDLKAYGIWNKMEVIYPFVGGTSTTNKYNLVDPQDTNGAYRINFQNSWTFNSTGSLPGASNAYGITYFNPSTFSNISTGMSFGYYALTSSFSAYVDKYSIGDFAAQNQFFSVEERITELDFKYCNNDQVFRTSIGALSTLQGFRQFSSSGSADGVASLSNASGTVTDTGTPVGSYPNLNFYVGSMNLSNSGYNSSRQYLAFAYMGTPLTATERTNYFTAVQAYQTTLGRQK